MKQRHSTGMILLRSDVEHAKHPAVSVFDRAPATSNQRSSCCSWRGRLQQSQWHWSVRCTVRFVVLQLVTWHVTVTYIRWRSHSVMLSSVLNELQPKLVCICVADEFTMNSV